MYITFVMANCHAIINYKILVFLSILVVVWPQADQLIDEKCDAEDEESEGGAYCTFSTFIMVLLLLGLLKGIIGVFCIPNVGMYGLGMIVDLPRPMPKYDEPDLAHFAVQYDRLGWPIHPITGERSVRALPKYVPTGNQTSSEIVDFRIISEFVLNIFFFLIYPIALIFRICAILCFSDDTDIVSITASSDFGDPQPRKANSKISPVSPVDTSAYEDQDARENEDTKYVFDELDKSRQSLTVNYIDSTEPRRRSMRSSAVDSSPPCLVGEVCQKR